jgi:putative endonuclease
MRTFSPCVYILASRPNGTLYIGVTSDLLGRTWKHRNEFHEGFTKKHRVNQLVWFELHPTMASAITRESAMKRWKREWKIKLIESGNPSWRDLYPELTGEAPDRSVD